MGTNSDNTRSNAANHGYVAGLVSMSKTSRSSYDPDYEALLDACRQGNLKAVRKFIQSGVDQNKPVGAPRGWSPIMTASYYGHLGIVKYLANQGARLDLIEVDGWWTALDLAVHSNQEEIVNYLKSIKAPRGTEIPNPFRRGKLGGWVTDER
ncbi:MAG: ankyrin repeat domain-containing protein [Gemmatales bacterium]